MAMVHCLQWQQPGPCCRRSSPYGDRKSEGRKVNTDFSNRCFEAFENALRSRVRSMNLSRPSWPTRCSICMKVSYDLEFHNGAEAFFKYKRYPCK